MAVVAAMPAASMRTSRFMCARYSRRAAATRSGGRAVRRARDLDSFPRRGIRSSDERRNGNPAIRRVERLIASSFESRIARSLSAFQRLLCGSTLGQRPIRVSDVAVGPQAYRLT